MENGSCVYRLVQPQEQQAVIDFINEHFDMSLPLINRSEFFEHYYRGINGELQFAVAEQNGQYAAVCGYILANSAEQPDVWASIWVSAKGSSGAGIGLMDAMPRLLNARIVACNNIRKKTCVLSVPCRYIHGPSSIMKFSDMEDLFALAQAFARQA